MKLETSEGERAELTAWCTMKTEEWKSGFAPELTEQTVWAKTARLLRDIDTLLAEVERLRAAPPAPPLPAEVEEMRKKLDGPHEWGYRCLAEGPFFISDPAPFAAASLLSRWPGGWRPIETAPKDGTNILLTDGTEVASGFWAEKIENAISIRPACWMVHWNIDRLGNYPTHWSPLPEPPHD